MEKEFIEITNTSGFISHIPFSFFLQHQESMLSSEKENGIHNPTESMTPFGFGPYGWTAPGYDMSHEFAEMRQQINGHGGAIDQCYAYFDYLSGADWEEVSRDHNFFTVFGNLPFQWITSTILSHLQDTNFNQKAIQFVGLGPGDGNNEIQLICHLLNAKSLKTTLHLLDSSHYLLQKAYREASNVLGRRGVNVCPLEGDFYHLPWYPLLFRDANEEPRQLRVGTFFGNTFGNLSHELHFVQDSLSAFHKGDLLILHGGLIYAPADQPELIKKLDPRFANYPGKELWEHWLCGPLVRYRKGLKKIKLQNVLDCKTGPVPGSYTVVIQAIVDDDVQIKLMRIKRYDENKLVRAFVDLGWRSLGGQHFGDDKKRMCYIFEKM